MSHNPSAVVPYPTATASAKAAVLSKSAHSRKAWEDYSAMMLARTGELPSKEDEEAFFAEEQDNLGIPAHQTLTQMVEELKRDEAKPGKNGETLRGKLEYESQFTREQLEKMDDWEKKKEMYRKKLAQILNTQRFDLCINAVILINSMTIGLESQMYIKGEDTSTFEAIEHLFLVIYSLELSARFFAFGVKRSLLGSSWVVFDFILVTLGVISQWIIPIIFAGDTPGALEPLFVFRVLRLLRLARAVRLIVTFKTLWLLVRGLLSSADTITFTFVLIAMTIYVFGVVGVELISKNKGSFIHRDDGTFAPRGYLTQLMEDDFRDLPGIMLSLLGFATLDSVNRIYAPMIKTEPMLFFYFVPFILVVAIAMMNLVTAVLVENALESSKNDKVMNSVFAKKKLEKMMPEIKRMFLTLDADGSGDISKEELTQGLDENPAIRLELEHHLGTLDPLQLFDTLDINGNGQISVSEFCDHLVDRVTSDAPMELTRVLKIVQQLKNSVNNLLSSQRTGMALTVGLKPSGSGGSLSGLATSAGQPSKVVAERSPSKDSKDEYKARGPMTPFMHAIKRKATLELEDLGDGADEEAAPSSGKAPAAAEEITTAATSPSTGRNDAALRAEIHALNARMDKMNALLERLAAAVLDGEAEEES